MEIEIRFDGDGSRGKKRLIVDFAREMANYHFVS